MRTSHRALNEIILPWDHPFRQYHTPPWEWNCRCQVAEDVAFQAAQSGASFKIHDDGGEVAMETDEVVG